jgi:hypothetical protein
MVSTEASAGDEAALAWFYGAPVPSSVVAIRSYRTLAERFRQILRFGLGVVASAVVVSFSLADRILPPTRRALAGWMASRSSDRQ